jgi:plasmid stability protein
VAHEQAIALLDWHWYSSNKKIDDRMTVLTIQNVPDTLYARLKARAEQNRRSLDQEVIACLEETVDPVPAAEQALMMRIRALREGVSIRLTEDLREAALAEGRP